MGRKKKHRNRGRHPKTRASPSYLKWFDLQLAEGITQYKDCTNVLEEKVTFKLSPPKNVPQWAWPAVMEASYTRYWFRCSHCTHVWRGDIHAHPMFDDPDNTEAICPICIRIRRKLANQARREPRHNDGNPRSLRDTRELDGGFTRGRGSVRK